MLWSNFDVVIETTLAAKLILVFASRCFCLILWLKLLTAMLTLLNNLRPIISIAFRHTHHLLL